MVYSYTGPLSKLINEFSRMPGIGPKSAQRLAFYILSIDKATADELIESINEVKEKVRYCKRCYNISFNELCDICSDPSREKGELCIVSEPKDMIAMEKTHLYRGFYHVLGGVISPINGIGPEALRIKELLKRINEENIKEIVFALNPNVEGEATMMYITNLVKPLGVSLSRIAYGLPVGSDMDYADENTLSKAYEGRINIT